MQFNSAKYRYLILVLGMVIISACSSVKQIEQGDKSQYQVVDTKEFQELIQGKNTIILDVREPDELVEEGFIENSVNIPLGQLEENLGAIKDLKSDTRILTYCRSGIRSGKAADKLINLGFKNVYSLDGGITKWKEDNLPIIK